MTKAAYNLYNCVLTLFYQFKVTLTEIVATLEFTISIIICCSSIKVCCLIIHTTTFYKYNWSWFDRYYCCKCTLCKKIRPTALVRQGRSVEHARQFILNYKPLN